VLLTLSAASLLAQPPESLKPAPANDPKVVRRWTVAGDPHGVAIGNDGTIYVGLAQPQAVIAVDPKSGAIRKRVVLDSAEIASTKELVTLRTNRAGTRLYIANGSDESAIILGLPDLHVIREITMEGEAIRDALPDPGNRYLYLLGRRVHVFDINGEKELHTIDVEDVSAIGASARQLVVAKGPAIMKYDATSFDGIGAVSVSDVGRMRWVGVANDGSVVALSDLALIEFGSGHRVEAVCFPQTASPQIATLTPSNTLLFVERRCSASTAFAGGGRHVTPASLYGVDAYAIAYDPSSNTLAATNRAGSLTIYKVPRAAIAH